LRDKILFTENQVIKTKGKSMNVLHIWPQEPIQQSGAIHLSALIEIPGEDRKTLWYKVPESHQQKIPATSDHFVIGTIFLQMKMGIDVHIHGQVSPSLLRNLVEFQSAWVAMRPDLSCIDITADHEQEDEPSTQHGHAIMAFSGGVDSCFTAFRHTRAKDVRFPRRLTTAIMVHGFDIPLDEPEGFALATVRSKRILSSLDIELIMVSTNYREVVGDWSHSHGAAIASCLSLFRKEFSEGLIGQTFTYGELRKITEGVNALTDPLLSSDNFRIVPDGAAFKRAGKILAMSDWSEFLHNLRVCWEGTQRDQNCCNCEKCMRNILTFRALGLGLPPCFEHDISFQQIKTLRMGDRERRVMRYEGLLPLAKAHGATGQWTHVVAQRLAAEKWAEDSKLFHLYRFSRRVAGKILAPLRRKGD
jgi:hypothetical protein